LKKIRTEPASFPLISEFKNMVRALLLGKDMEARDLQRGTLEKFVEEVSHMIRSRYPLIFLNSYEESRCLEVLKGIAERRQSTLYVWSRTQGTLRKNEPCNDIYDPMQILKWFEESSENEKSLLVLKDFHPYLKEPGIVRKLRDMAQKLKQSPKNILFLSPVVQIPPELTKEVSVLDVPLPSRVEIAGLIQKALQVLKTQSPDVSVDIEALIDAAMGLTYDEIENVLARSIVSRGSLDKSLVQDEKRQIVKKSGLLEFLESVDRGVTVGGLDLLKKWLVSRHKGFSAEARELQLPIPKGMLLVGVPGCGKSLTASTISREWQLPLLRLDLGRVFSGIVGSSESNIRNAIATCEAVAPCILWIDEIEKGLSGTKSSGQSDGGTTSRVFGSILTWMQEKKSPVFVVATANDISQLPPEFLRKGRFDEIFFIDLPNTSERKDIFSIHMKRFGWEAEGFNAQALAEKADGFSGAEIEQSLISARYNAFSKNEAFCQLDILEAIAETVPLSKTMGDRLEGLRSWAKHRARPASISSESFELKNNRLEFVK